MSEPLGEVLAPRAPGQGRPRGPGAVYVVTVVLAACSILYELAAAQTMSLLAANTVVWYSLTVGTYLLGMGLGSWWSRGYGRERPWAALFRVEITLTVLGGLSVFLLHFGHMTWAYFSEHGMAETGRVLFFGLAGLVVLGVGVLTGMELPLLIRLARRHRDESAVANLVLGLDYVGSLLGGVVFALVLLPRVNLFAVGLLTAAANLGVAMDIQLTHLGRKPRALLRYGGLAVVWISVFALFLSLNAVRQYFLRKYYYYLQSCGDLAERLAPMPDFPGVLRRSSPYQKIDLVRDVAPDYSAYLMPAYSTKLEEDPDYPVDYILCLNGDFQLNTRYDEIYHEWFAHVPVITTGVVPRRVLLLGGGDGQLLRELLEYDGVEEVVHVDLDPELIRLARNNRVLAHANDDALRDPRVTTIIGDGYQYVRRSSRAFDAIYVDFPAAADYDLAKLYSREFFHFLRERIAPGGYAAFDSVGTSFFTPFDDEGKRWITAQNDWPKYYHTLRQAGFGTILPYVSSLERRNEQALGILRRLDIDLGAEYELAMMRAETGERREEIRDNALLQLLDIHVVALEQGFIILAPDERELVPAWRDPGVDLHVLNEERYGLSFSVEYPMPEEVDPDLVNSILRPTFPSTPWWRPRKPY